LLADGVGTMFGALTGTSTVTSYIESAAGVAAGRARAEQRDGGGLFLAAIVFSPMAAAISGIRNGAGTDLVGALMTESLAQVDWKEFSEAFPAFVTLVATPLTFSIATGLSLGVISYTVAKVAAGKFREVSVLLWILTLVFVLR